ncbi:MAG: hypothetical protein WAM52_17115, partial [Steroidobacteraceae bacterium]
MADFFLPAVLRAGRFPADFLAGDFFFFAFFFAACFAVAGRFFALAAAFLAGRAFALGAGLAAAGFAGAFR